MASKEIEYRQQGLDDRWKFARALAAADDMLPKGVRGIVRPADGSAPYQGVIAGKVFLITETARMLGIDPMAGLQGINVIEGSASIAPSLMQALVRAAGHKLRVRTVGSLAEGTLKAIATLTRSDDPEPFEVEWTLHDAVQADLAESYEPDENGVWHIRSRSDKDNKLNWEKYPRQMLKWRAQAEVVRDGAEEVLMGVHYTPEELGAIVREDGTEESATAAQMTEVEADIIGRIAEATTKDELVAIWDEFHEHDAWIGKPEATYYVKLGEVNVEDADVVEDDDPETAPPAPSAPASQDETEPTAENPSEGPKPADGRTAPQDGPIISDPATLYADEDYEAAERAAFDAAVARGEVQP